MTISVLPSTLESLLLPATYPALLRAPGITAIPKWKHSVANRSLDQIFHPHILFNTQGSLLSCSLLFAILPVPQEGPKSHTRFQEPS